MSGFTTNFGTIEGQVDVIELASNGEGGEETVRFPISTDTEALLIATAGDGGANLTINGETAHSSGTTLAFSTPAGNLTYINTDPSEGEGILTLFYQPGRRLIGWVVRFTRQPFDWLRRQLMDRGSCWTCKQIIGALLRALAAPVGPGLPLLDDVVVEGGALLGEWFGDFADLPSPLHDLLARFVGADWQEVVRDILQYMGRSPFGTIAEAICTWLKYCPTRLGAPS